ncbi:MAG: cupin domain-containing protein [Pseudomonadota bacterium]
MTMTAILKDGPRMPLDVWGKPEDIGSETIEGDILCEGSVILGGLDKPVFGGQYSVTRGKYRVTYGFHEHATLIEGEVALTNENTGETVVYKAGDSWLIAKGTPILWDIRSDVARKSYLAVTIDL